MENLVPASQGARDSGKVMADGQGEEDPQPGQADPMAADILNQRYNQFKVSFDEQKLPLRQGYNRRLGKMLLKHFPKLYRFRLLILISEVGEKLIMSELELIYWYTVILEYLRQLRDLKSDLFLNFDAKDKNGQGKLWNEENMSNILILCGMYTKKELFRL